MDLRFSQAGDAFRQAVREFIRAEPPPAIPPKAYHGRAPTIFGGSRKIQRNMFARTQLEPWKSGSGFDNNSF